MANLENVIFVHIPRCAGKSIAMSLGIYKREHPHFFARKHKVIRSDWADCFKFAFVRNPWDRAVSLYYHQTRGDKSFKEWLMDIVRRDGLPCYNKAIWKVSNKTSSTGGKGVPWKSQMDWIVGDDGKPCMDFVGYYESLHGDFIKLCQLLEIKTKLCHLHKSIHDHYSEYYDEECKKIVADWHRKDIDYFGYKFEKPVLML